MAWSAGLSAPDPAASTGGVRRASGSGRAIALSHPLDCVAESLGQGDPDAYDQLYEAMVDRLYGFAYRFIGDRSDAEDAVQQAFLELAQSDTRPEDGRSLESWLFASVRFTCLDHLRRRSRRPEVPREHLPDVQNEDQYQLGLDPELEEALRRLTAEQRLTLHLRYVEGMDGHQIAELIGSNRVAVYAMIGRAQRRLKRLLAMAEPLKPVDKEDPEHG